MTIKKGDLVTIEFTGRTGGKVFDTNVKSIGEKEGMKRTEWKPLLVTTGSGDVISGLEDALIGMEKGKGKKVELKPEEAYGKRNSELVKVVPLKVFTQNDVNPAPGMVVNLDNMPARVQSVSGGRVRVDFNHELAGKDIEFEVKVLGVFDKDVDKVKEYAKYYLPAAKVDYKEGKAKVAPTTEELKNRDYQALKGLVISNMLSRTDAKAVEFTEEYKR